jgi:predicted nucleic acid-binding protein
VAVSRYCLDTSAYSHFKRGVPEVVERLDCAEWIGVPSIVLGELWTGFLLGDRFDQNQAELRQFLANPAVDELLVDGEVAHIYGEIVASLRRAGTPLPTNDIWIAATAVRAGAVVLTYDPHYQAIQRVGSEILASPT